MKTENKQLELTVPKEIDAVTETLKKANFEAYLVGGCVRDLLLNIKPKDWDIATDAKPDDIIKLFPKTFYENNFGTVGVVNETAADETLKVVEVTPFRLEGEYSDFRRPDKIEWGKSLSDDLKRRDFTINALALDIEKFKTPEEELNYLRAKVSSHEKILANKGESIPQDEIIKKEITAHGDKNPKEVLDENYAFKKHEVESIVLDLSPEAHDAQMGELVGILQEKGVLNALSVVFKLKDPHIEDDFHRFLVQYIKAGFRVANEKEKSPLLKALKMTLFEVSLPSVNKDETQKNKNNGQKDLFDNTTFKATLALASTAPALESEKLKWEKELLGLYITSHPLKHFEKIMGQKTLPITKISRELTGKLVKICGVISTIKKIITKTGRPMLFMGLEDQHDKIEVVVFPSIMERSPGLFQENKIVLISGRVDMRDGTPKIICNEVEEIVEEG